jgi:hypothetical protein
MMLKLVQAYFPSEDKAETAKSLMARFKTGLVEISRLGNTEDEKDIPVVVPFAGDGYPVSGLVPAGLGGKLNGGILIDRADEPIDHSLNGNHMTFVLSTRVEEEDYDAIVDIVRNNQGDMEL